MSAYSIFKKIIVAIGIALAAVILFLAVLWLPIFNREKKIEFGANFSKPYAESLGLDWQAAYLAVLDDLGAPYLRLESEWDQIEKTEGNYDFSALDWQMAEADKWNAKVLLVVGERQPRWPECHVPEWLADSPQTEIQNRLMEFIRVVVLRYKDSPALLMWQVENEPLLNFFGECPPGDINFLKQEIALVKSLDSRPIVITDSGELSTWRRTAHLGDYFGTSIYRAVYDPRFGYIRHFLAPAFYRLKAKLVGLSLEKTLISELQTEPWLPSRLDSTGDMAEEKKVMGPEDIQKQIDFARQIGFPRAYVWGVEWWYWLKEQGDDSVWNVGKNIWQP
jgi:hypothetical protein